MDLTPGHLTALRNLASKQSGGEVDWINIADARALTELGFAARSREGWQITPEGASALEATLAAEPDRNADRSARHQPIPMRRPEHEGE